MTMRERMTAIQSHHMTRWRKRRENGNSRNTRNKANPTWIMRNCCVGTIPYAAYRWNNDITTATAATIRPSKPARRLIAPSSASMYSSAFLSAASSTAMWCSAAISWISRSSLSLIVCVFPRRSSCYPETKNPARGARWISIRPAMIRGLFDVQSLFAEIFDRPRVKRDHDGRIGLVLQVEVLRFLVHPDHIFLLVEHRLHDV